MQDSLKIGGQKISHKTAVLIGFIGIFMVAISTFFGGTTEDIGKVEQNQSEMTQYITETETRIGEILTSVEGVGAAKVMITLESGNEFVYAKDETISPSESGEMTESRYILLNGSDGEEALVLRELSPKIQGVVVVCEGGDNPLAVEKVTEIISTALGIGYMQISVQTKAA